MPGLVNESFELSVLHFSFAFFSIVYRNSGKIGNSVTTAIVRFVTSGLGAVAHRLEQAAHNHLVEGSIPSSPTRGEEMNRFATASF